MRTEILIVDDDQVFVMIQRLLLVECGLNDRLLVFSNGREALDFLKASSGEDRFFLVLLDINMPVMDGWEFLNAISDTFPIEKVRVILVSSSVNVRDKQKANQYRHVISYLEKPINLETLIALKTIL